MRDGDLSAGEISGHFSISKSTLSAHLKLLREANLVVTERSGSTIFYSLNMAVYEEVISVVLGLMGLDSKDGTGASDQERGSDVDER